MENHEQHIRDWFNSSEELNKKMAAWKAACGDLLPKLEHMEVRVVMRSLQRLKNRGAWKQANQLWLALLYKEVLETSTPLRVEWKGGAIPNFYLPYGEEEYYSCPVLVNGRQRCGIPAPLIAETAWPFLVLLPGDVTPAHYDAKLDA